MAQKMNPEAVVDDILVFISAEVLLMGLMSEAGQLILVYIAQV